MHIQVPTATAQKCGVRQLDSKMYMLRFLVVMVLGAFAVADHESISGSKIRTADQLSHALLSLSAGPILSFTHGYTSLLSAIEPSPTPMTTAEASSRLAAVYSAYPKDFYGAAAAVLLSGMTGESSFGKPLTVRPTSHSRRTI